jgi:uncharacterized membrane-anchored protein
MSAEAPPNRGLTEHAQRRALAGEVHARPFDILTAPLRASRIAVMDCDPEVERAHLRELAHQYGAEPPGSGAHYFSRTLGQYRLRWERHTEFSTYTVYRFGPFDLPFAKTALDHVPQDWLASLPGAIIAAMHVAAEVGECSAERLAVEFDANALIGSRVMGDAAVLWTDFRLHADGFARALVCDLGMNGRQLGRLVQRVMEIETYRMMALLAFPEARQASGEIFRLDGELASIVTALADPDAEVSERALLDRLTPVAAEAERLEARTGFRLSAARAYYAILNQRVAELRESRIQGVQTLGEFMDRRLAPAMKTCESVTERQQILARRAARAGDLLRTRVDIALEEKNRDLLRSMDHRARVQLRLQETVEGLSVVAISYYLVGLVGYAAKGAKAAGLHIDPDAAILLALPLVLGMVWLGVRRLRKALVPEEE